MKKLFLFSMLCIVGVLGLRAQTDVTSTYLTNADFSQTTPIATNLKGYGKDMGTGATLYGLQPVDGWTSVVISGDNSNSSYPNSGMGGAVFAYGSNYQVQGNGKTAPATDPDGNSGNCLGYFGVWGCGGYYYQEVTLAAGKYTINIPVYNQSGIQANTSYIGWIPNSGTSYTLATNPTVGSWTTLTTTFTLVDATKGKICLGYKSTGSGSGSNAMLFFDKVQILYTAIVVKDVLSTAITAATNANATLNNSSLTSAIATAQAVYEDDNATQEEVNNAAATLNAATELAMSAAGDVTGIFLSNPGFENCSAETSDVAAKIIKDYSTSGWTNASTGSYTTIAVTAYGGGVKVGNSTTPSTKKDGTTVFGNTLGIIAGWADGVTIQSDDVTMPAGVYTLTIDHYPTSSTNYNNASSRFGFVTSSNSYLVSSTTFAESTWTTETVTFTLTEATTGKIQIGLKGTNTSGSGSPAVFYDDITITYSSFLAGAKAEWDDAVAAANQAKTDCPNVKGEELTALNAELAKAEPTTVEGYNQAKADIEAATATLTAAKPAYDAYIEICGIATTLGVATGNAPSSAAAAVTATHTLNVAVYNVATAENMFDVTEVYAPTWSSMNTSSGQHWSGDASISYADEWRGDTNPTSRTATITLPAGEYVLMSTGRGSENTVTTMTANVTTVTYASNGDMGIGINKEGVASFDAADAAGFSHKDGQDENTGTGWEWRYIPVTLTAEGDVTITQTLTRLSGGAWGSFCDFKILKKGVVATTADYTALKNAIANAESKTLGFEDGQYAPYNNVAALEALVGAKAIDQTAKNEQETIHALTAALNSWTANSGDVDAIYNGMFTTVAKGQNYPDGWTRTNVWGQMQSEIAGDYATAYYNQPGSLQYGNQGIYTMPLAANQTYKLTFSYRSHENNSNTGVTASLRIGEEVIGEKAFIGNGSTSEWKTATAYFTTETAGNYVLTLANGGNTWMTNVSLVKGVAGDANADGAINGKDLKAIVRIVLGYTQDEQGNAYDINAADMDGKNGVTVSDVTKFVNVHLK